MNAFASTTDPIDFCEWLQTNNIKFSFNSLKLLCKTAIFNSVYQLLIHKNNIGHRCVVVFDVEQKLQMLTNATIANDVDFLKQQFKEQKNHIKHLTTTKEIDQVFKTLKNNEGGIMHVYNDNLYKIKSKDLRERLKNLILQYSAGKLSQNQIKMLVEEIKLFKRNPNTQNTVDKLMNLIQTDEFTRIRQTIMELQKKSTPITNSTIEILATKNVVEAYDVRYLFKVLNK